MNLEKVLNYLFENPNDIKSFSYSNINGEESLKINGEEILDKYDDSKLLSEIAKCKKILDSLDDCTFADIVDELKKDENIKELNEIFEKEHITEEENDKICRKLKKINDTIYRIVNNKIYNLTKILEQL